jgi:hypothetical protein
MSTAQFYDGLADTYHALYPDWVGEVRAQAASLHRLLGRWHREPADIADVACGIGTQPAPMPSSAPTMPCRICWLTAMLWPPCGR